MIVQRICRKTDRMRQKKNLKEFYSKRVPTKFYIQLSPGICSVLRQTSCFFQCVLILLIIAVLFHEFHKVWHRLDCFVTNIIHFIVTKLESEWDNLLTDSVGFVQGHYLTQLARK